MDQSFRGILDGIKTIPYYESPYSDNRIHEWIDYYEWRRFKSDTVTMNVKPPAYQYPQCDTQ